MAFEIRTEYFNGPFDLLLDLIERRKFLINEISLAKVTDDFIAYIGSQENFPMGESARFILVAATLVLIKSKSLLPTLELSSDEQGDIKSLEIRLAMYRRIREAGVGLQERYGTVLLFAPEQRNFVKTVFAPGNLSRAGIMSAIQRVVAQIPRVEKLPKAVVQKVISLETMIEKLTKRVEQSLKINFREFSGRGKSEKINVIVGFLAMLELIKRGIIKVEQKTAFDEIEMETGSIGTPKYS
ncbi:MAG: ScpA family protein [Patescibacteria group bacterium]